MDTEQPTAAPRPSAEIVGPSRSERRRFSGTTLFLACIVSAFVASGGTFLASRKPRPQLSTQTPEKYQCRMHPKILQDHPGTCPICGMNLVHIDDATPGSPTERKVLMYRSPMNPKQTSPTPRKDEMGMDYLPVYADDTSSEQNPVLGMAAITIDPERQQLIGLRTATVVDKEIGGQFRTVGRIAIDETRVRHANVKTGGFVEKIFVDYIGKRVGAGAPLFTLYSPELLAAQEEYLLALKARANLSNPLFGSDDAGKSLVDSARRRLELWDISGAELQKLEATGIPTKTLTIHSPASGVVTKKDVVEGMRLDPGAMPYEIVDLSSVWVIADIYESDLRFVKEGTPGTLTLKAFPDRSFEEKVIFLDPLLDSLTRTVKVRLALPNPTGDLRPEMFGEVVLKTGVHTAAVIPLDAIIDSGTQKIVLLALPDGKFEPRRVETGQSEGDQIEVTAGLVAGDKVVTRANFLIDSESRLKASLSAMSGSSSKPPESARVLPDTTTSSPVSPIEQKSAAP